MQLYKLTNLDGSCANGGTGKWHLPRNGRAGRWMPRITGELIPCQRGYHLCRIGDLLEWAAPALWLAEHDGEIIEAENKIVVARARLISRNDRWNDRMLRLFACDCADRVRHLADDERSAAAIDVARRFANGDATTAELGANWEAARGANWGTERGWQIELLKWYLGERENRP